MARPSDDDGFDEPAPSDRLRALARRGVVKAYKRNTVLIREGEPGDTLYIILSGRLRAFTRNDDETRHLIYGDYGPGEYVGEMGLDGRPRSASVMAVEPSRCALVTKTTLLQHLADEPEFALELLAKVIAIARTATLSARQLAFNDVYTRLRAHLEQLARRADDGGWQVEPRPTQADLAAHAGCTREMVGRVLRELRKGDLLQDDGSALRWRALPLRF